MFFSAERVIASLKNLRALHPFFGTTYLVCKRSLLPAGKLGDFPMADLTNGFLDEYHRLQPYSNWYYQPYKTSGRDKVWFKPDYEPAGLMTLNKAFASVFMPKPDPNKWGWQENYVEKLRTKLPKGKPLPVFDLAVWICRKKKWDVDTSPADIIQYFIAHFNFTAEERILLLDETVPSVSEPPVFNPQPTDWADLSSFIPPPPDAGSDQKGTLTYLRLEHLGPTRKMELIPARRLNIITGDNGLGKSFLLECAWWALTGTWPGIPAYPKKSAGTKKEHPAITFELSGTNSQIKETRILYDFNSRTWPKPKKRPTISGLMVYARVDETFAVWDPAHFNNSNDAAAPLVFTGNQVWDGLTGSIEGLIRDWVKWQNMPAKYPFDIFCQVLNRLSPPDLGGFTPGEPVRIPNDPRDIPTIKHPYGLTPLLYASAGVRRIITLAYLMVWVWHEHRIQSELSSASPASRMVVMIDEIEAHLHPKWQRAILPAMLDVQKAMAHDLDIQFLITTHSPLIMVSAEPEFDDDCDKLFHLDLGPNNEVTLDEKNFTVFGQVNSWLTSPVFELRHARSREAEQAIEAAKKIQLSTKVDLAELKEINDRLLKYLAADDAFWPRWVYFAEKHGVKA
ncbi:MAG: AAA family ATPase [Syntrophomonadaceae bacterium]|nr:AAA family ATPase [Syntrophomonadaceae bacterium]